MSDDKPQTETPITDALDADVRLLPPEMQRAPLLQHARDLERDLHAAGDGDTWEAAYNRVMAELEALRNEPDRGG